MFKKWWLYSGAKLATRNIAQNLYIRIYLNKFIYFQLMGNICGYRVREMYDVMSGPGVHNWTIHKLYIQVKLYGKN